MNETDKKQFACGCGYSPLVFNIWRLATCAVCKKIYLRHNHRAILVEDGGYLNLNIQTLELHLRIDQRCMQKMAK